MLRRPPRSTRTDPLFPSPTLVRSLPRQVARVRPCKKDRHTRGLDRLPYETQRNGALERLARFVGRYVLTIGIGGDDRIDHVHADAILAPFIGGCAAERADRFLGGIKIGRASCRERVCQYV